MFAGKHRTTALIAAATIVLGVPAAAAASSAQANSPAKTPPHVCGVYYKYNC
jgi:hypothetical protein